MKYLKDYFIFKESLDLNIVTKVINIINNYLFILGLSIKINSYTTSNKIVCYLNIDIVSISNSLLQNIIKAILDGHNASEVYPKFDSFNVNDVEGRIRFIINTNDVNDVENDTVKLIKSYNDKELINKVINQTIEIFESANGDFDIEPLTHQPNGPHIIHAPFINTIIINYLKLLLKSENKGNSNSDKLYKITYDAIKQNPDCFKLLNNIKKIHLNLFNNLKRFDKNEIDQATDMGEMGF